MTSPKAGAEAERTPARASAGRRRVAPAWWWIELQQGFRPFLPLREDGEAWWGWILPDPHADHADPFLREAGVQPSARQQPCYLRVPSARLHKP